MEFRLQSGTNGDVLHARPTLGFDLHLFLKFCLVLFQHSVVFEHSSVIFLETLLLS